MSGAERDLEVAPWRVGRHYNIHVYEGDRPVATFLRPEDAQRAVDAVNRSRPTGDAMTTTAGPWPPDLTKKPTIPYFENEDDRDRCYAEWVAAGNTLVNGSYCVTRGAHWLRVKGEWRQVG